ncbi:hypothetical protein FRACYDRAFT_236425 [Fragilariopsis cylindrus CCMP1102]|uniref:DUF6824 domain-containing protein n=1 Tax=Fragilariopsis cylindrus CCMP1102 TaxID=635003 RepID=A0A1E7FQA8_9STRA|nr:hypothetical protein FRACYDRAFT_236425 [Fragilariopsis cylindrus CCMP1102]|eukprot:OEU20351.1 hypothetical protein FRACYDRAFT_236425 [Fragilariopsis cylindrus CCMP1102]
MRQRRLSMNRASAKARRSHKKCLLSSLTTPAPSESAVRPNNQDVLLGLGKPVRNHNGNRKMAGLIVQYRRQYNESKNGQKGAIVEEILGILSTDGGRFLRRYNEDSTGWTEVPQQVAFKKVCDAFRSQGKIAKAEAERRNEKIQDDKRAKKAEVVAERKEKKRKRVEEKEQKEQEVVAERKEKKSKRAEEKEQKEQEVVAERKEKKRKRVEEKEQKKQDVAAERKKMKMAQALAKKILQEQKEQDKSEQKAPFNSNNKKRSSDNITKASNETTTTTTTTTNAYSLIEKTPTQRLETGYRQLTPKQTTELLVVLRKISNVKNAFLGHSFVTKDTTSRALKYLLSAIRHGLMHYPDTCHPKVVQWNGVSKFCINSHIPLLIALFMALRNDDDNHKFNSEEWNKIHTEVMYGCQYAIDRKRREKGNVGCNSNPLTGSTIEKTGEVDKDGKLVWKRIDARPKFLNNANIRNTSHQFTGGGTGSAYITRTVDGVSIVWPEFNDIITVQAITDLGKSLMNHLSITDHSVVGKLLEMRHWHSMNYFGHRPVGIYWFHKDGGTLSSMTNDEMESVASKGAQWIKSTAQYK